MKLIIRYQSPQIVSTCCLLFIILLFCQCTKEGSLPWALELAAENRSELESVLSHYQNKEPDTLKYKAAVFLITNMPGHYSYRGNEILEYYEEVIPVLDSHIDIKEKKDSIERIANRYPGLRRKTVEDVEIITAEYLINNIDRAFELWEKPWARHLTFEQFCEYLLPYKYTELQVLDAWRDTLCTKFCNALNAIPQNDELCSSTFNVAQVINTEIRHTVWVISLYWLGDFSGYNFWSAGTIHKLPFGLCPDYVALGVLAFRSHGVPAVAEYTPIWGRGDTGHSWYTILNDDGSSQLSHYDVTSNFGVTLFPTRKIPKVYRQTYARNPATAKYMQKARYVPPFINLFQVDVTDEYFATSDVAIPLTTKKYTDRYAYIATFNDSDWMPIDYGEIKRNKALFQKMGRDLLYIALSYDEVKMQPISHPFIIHKNGRVEYVVADTAQRQTVHLWRKYPKSFHVADVQQRMLGGKIQAANKKDFSDSITLHTIDTLNYPDRIPLDKTGAYRYFRYLPPPGAWGNIAELAFFDKEGKEVRGVIIGEKGNPEKGKEKAFDGDWLTYYDSWEKIPWVGMDFGGSVHIEKVRCVPRTDDNYIHPGDVYELKYWELDRWESLGTKTADENMLIYEDVPVGALLWLSNLTRGKQERVFTYEKGMQVWW